jgi:molecular chaperone DnaK
LKDLGDQVPPEEKQQIETAADSLKEALKSDNKEDIEAKTQKLAEVSSKMAERIYAQKGAPGAEAGSQPSGEQPQPSTANENVVDAEFEEVKDKDDDKNK